jgi:hypothetical protein
MALHMSSSLKLNKSAGVGISSPGVASEARTTSSVILKVNDPIQTAPNYDTRVLNLSQVLEDQRSRSVRKLYVDLEHGYKRESYIRQAVDKYAEKLVTNIWEIKDCIRTDQPAVQRYITHRLNLMSLSTGYSFTLTLADIGRKLSRDGVVYLIKAYTEDPVVVTGFNVRAVSPKGKLAGLFIADAKFMYAIKDKDTGDIIAWLYKDENLGDQGVEKVIALEDLYILMYAPDGSIKQGNSQFAAALGDLRALRSLEDGVLKLVYRYLNPLIHISTPDLNGTTLGDQSEIDIYSSAVERMSHDGFFVTGPNVTIKAIGAESQALRTEGYLNFFKTRGLAGLGMSGLMMGEGNYVNNAGASALSAQMYDRATFYQKVINLFLTEGLLKDLLLEIGMSAFDNKTGDFKVKFVLPDFDDEEVRRRQNHWADLFTKGIAQRDEARKNSGMAPIGLAEDTTLHGIKARLDSKVAKAKAVMKPKPPVKKKPK